MNDVLTETSPSRKAKALDRLYDLNEGERNYLTGSSGNAVCAFLAAYDPAENVSVISLKDRRSILHYLGVDVPFDWDRASIGTQIVETNQLVRDAARALGVEGSARTISRFFYFPAVKALWRGEHTVQLPGRSVSVAVPTERDDDELAGDHLPQGLEADALLGSQHGPHDAAASASAASSDEIRESMQIQALLAKIGTMMGFTPWQRMSRLAGGPPHALA